MQRTETYRLLPRGATKSSARLCVTVFFLTPLNISLITPETDSYEITYRPQHAALRTLHALGDACLTESGATQDSQYPTEVPHRPAAQPLRTLSRTDAAALQPAHTGHQRLPLPAAQREGRRGLALTARGGRGRRHHRPP